MLSSEKHHLGNYCLSKQTQCRFNLNLDVVWLFNHKLLVGKQASKHQTYIKRRSPLEASENSSMLVRMSPSKPKRWVSFKL